MNSGWTAFALLCAALAGLLVGVCSVGEMYDGRIRSGLVQVPGGDVYRTARDAATDIADRICAAVTTSSAQYTALAKRKGKRLPSPKPTVNDVPVEGQFVRKR